MSHIFLNLLNKTTVIKKQYNNNQNKTKIILVTYDTNNLTRLYFHFIMKKLNLNYDILSIKKLNDIDYKYFLNNSNINVSKSEFMYKFSKLLVIQYAIDNKYKKFLVLEDFVIFHKNFKIYLKNICFANYLIVGGYYDNIQKKVYSFATFYELSYAKLLIKNIKPDFNLLLIKNKICKNKIIISHGNLLQCNDKNFIDFYKKKFNLKKFNAYYFILLDMFKKSCNINLHNNSSEIFKILFNNYFNKSLNYKDYIDCLFLNKTFINMIIKLVKKNNFLYNFELSQKIYNDIDVFCLKCVEINKTLKNIPLSKISPLQNNQVVLIVDGFTNHIEFLIRNSIHVTNGWYHTILCSKDVNSIKELSNSIDVDIQVISFNDIESTYTTNIKDIVMNNKFHKFINGEKLLIYKENCCQIKDIKNFLDYDIIYSPNYNCSLWTKQLIIDCFEKKESIDNCISNDMLNFFEKKFITIQTNFKLNYKDEWKDMLNSLQYNYEVVLKDNLSNKEKNKILAIPKIFHKELLGIVDIKKDISYEVKKKIKLKDVFLTHIHCYDLNLFNEYYSDYILDIIKISDIVVTYSIGDFNFDFDKLNAVFIKIPNKGMDIGGKFCVVDFIIKNKKNYRYILFLHSKTNDLFRKNWFHPLIKNLQNIKYSRGKELGCIVPPNIRVGNNEEILGLKIKHINYDYLHSKSKSPYIYNSIYMEEIKKFFNINSDITIFPEGNCYILHYKVYLKIFSDKSLYNILNTLDTFDFSWVKQLNFLTTNNIFDVYYYYKKYNCYGNNLKYLNKETKQGFSDGMIEHVFERIIFMVTKMLKYKIKILYPNEKINDIVNKIYEDDIIIKKNNKILLK